MTTNQYSEVLKELKEIKAMQRVQGLDVESLKNWKLAEDAYRAALLKVKQEEEDTKYTNLRDTELKKRTEILKQVGIIAAIIIAILYAYATTHGIKT